MKSTIDTMRRDEYMERGQKTKLQGEDPENALHPLYLFRVIAAKRIDRLFYEHEEATRYHHRVYRLFILPILGIGTETFADYLRIPDGPLRRHPLPDYIDHSFRCSILLVKTLSADEAGRCLAAVHRALKIAVREMKAREAPASVDRLLDHLVVALAAIHDGP